MLMLSVLYIFDANIKPIHSVVIHQGHTFCITADVSGSCDEPLYTIYDSLCLQVCGTRSNIYLFINWPTNRSLVHSVTGYTHARNLVVSLILSRIVINPTIRKSVLLSQSSVPVHTYTLYVRHNSFPSVVGIKLEKIISDLNSRSGP